MKIYNVGNIRLFEIIMYVLYSFFWVIPLRLNFKCRRFGTLCQFPVLGDSRRLNCMCRRFGTISSLFLVIPRHTL